MSAPAFDPHDIPLPTRFAQARASDPEASAWVSANAGSGKTHVLAQRVLRLLLGGAPPARLLCLTFTKAAAANMAARVFSTLADWTRLSDGELSAAIVAAGAARPDAARLSFARRLFARTIETPGGLKIQTIHAFCERLLHLFPFEANVAAGFRVVEERDAARLLERARGEGLADFLNGPEGERKLAALARDAGAHGFDELLREGLAMRGNIAEALAAAGDTARYGEALGERLGLAPGEDAASIAAAILGGLGGRANWPGLAEQLARGGKKDNELADCLRAAHAAKDAGAALEAYLGVFFTVEDEPRGGAERRIVTNGLAAQRPGLIERLRDEQSRLMALREKYKAALTRDRSVILIELIHGIIGAYASLKGQRGLLDFDDLIERTLSLLTRVDAAWVLYKLDSGIDHILVDEAQDTSEPQWEILRRLAEDFTSGKGARAIIRTFFAVGDEKQSIYSFQGAAPAMFARMRREFARRHANADLDFAEVPLHLSFRSAPRVLEGVDRIFAVPTTWQGVAEDDQPPPHEAFRVNLPGLVEIWAPIEGASEAASDDWRMPLDAASGQDPAVQLARRIAKEIADWLSPTSPERLHGPDGARRIAPGDIMILVRSRGAFFEAMIRALKEKNIKAAGADRLALGEHIATLDLISAGRAALLPEDDLSLACLMKSPLLGLDDEDLIAIAPERAGSLAEALAEAPGEKFAQARARLRVWRERAPSLSPFAFYARLLGQDGGRRALLSRLGPEAGDAIDEFLSLALAHEQNSAPSLMNFLQEIAGADVSVKRDMEASGDSVRVMTVHAAKGLESSIVFLPDTCAAPTGRHDPKLFVLETAGPVPIVAWSPRTASDPPVVAAARALARKAAAGEHRRLFYVAMTRAAERLIIAGFHGPQARSPECWYAMARAGLDGATAKVAAPWNAEETIWRLGEPWREAGAPPAGPAAAAAADRTPPWLRVAARPERAAASLNPSRALAAPFGSSFFDAERESRIAAGRLGHALLQYLPDVATERRREAAQRLFAECGAGVAAAEREAMLARVLSVIDHPDLAALFGAQSRAEVAVAAHLPRPGACPASFVGRIDRMAVGEESVLVADFKSGAARDGAIPAPYVAQLALYRAALAPLYPGLALRAFLVFLDRPDIVEIAPAALDAALERLLGPAPA